MHLTPNIFLAPKKLLVLLITTVKKLSSYDLSSIFCEFSPLWFTAESQGKLGPSEVVTSAGESNTPSLSCLMTSFEGLKLFQWLIFKLRSFEARNFTNCRFVAPSAQKLKFDSPADVTTTLGSRSPRARSCTRKSKLQTSINSRGFNGFA